MRGCTCGHNLAWHQLVTRSMGSPDWSSKAPRGRCCVTRCTCPEYVKEDENLTDFLLARVAEDEAVAREGLGLPVYGRRNRDPERTAHSEMVEIARDEGVWTDLAEWFTPARVLAECEAKRRIIRTMRANGVKGLFVRSLIDPAQEEYIHKLMAIPYADHPDFRPEWRA